MKLSDWLPSVFVEGDGDDIQVSTKKFSQFPTATGEGIQGVGIKDGNNVKFELTTDSIKVNPAPFRNAKGQFIGTPEELAGLENQRDVNNFLYEAINDIEAGDINLEGYATEDWVIEQLDAGMTQDEKVALIEAQIQYRGLMELDADDKPVWPADQTRDRGGWWAYPSSKLSSLWKHDKLEWIFPYSGEDFDITKKAAPEYKVGDIIQLQISDNEAGAGTNWQYFDTAPVYVEYMVEEVYYPNTQAGNENKYNPAYRVSMSGPIHRYSGSLPNVVKGPQGDPDDAWIQWYPTVFAFGTAVPEVDLGNYVSKTGGDSMEGPLNITTQPGTGSRESRRINTLGVYSNSDSSALRLGTTRDRVYIGHNETSFNGPILVDEIQEKNADNGILLANQAVLAEEGTEPNHLITKGYVDGADQQLQGEIEQVALALEALLTSRTAGQWAYDGTVESGPPRTPGTFKAMADMSATENYLALHMEDANGISHAFGDAEVGDYIEVVDMDDPKVYALYVLTAEPPISGTIVELPVKLKDRGADFEIGDSCTIRHFAVNQEDINLSELDERYVEKSKGDQTMTGPLTISGLGAWEGSKLITERMEAPSDSSILKIGTPSKQDALRVYKDQVKVSSVPFVCKTIQEYATNYGTKYEGAFTDPDHIATKKDVDDLPYLPKSGGELTGQLTIKKGTQVALDIVGDANESQIKFWSSGAIALEKYTAFKDNELVTKKYVDDKVVSGGGSSFAPGDQVAKTDGVSANVGGFWVSNGALYCKVN